MPLAFPPLGTRTVSASAITIAASTWRWDGVSGAVKVSSGIPLQPGMLTAANLNTYRVFVGGVEQAIAAHPLDGTFPDGSYRSVLTQYSYTLTHNLPIAAEIRINQGVRGTTDIAFVEPVLATVAKKAVIAPTDPTYLCGTFVTLTPLTPATNDTGLRAAWATYAVNRWSDTGVANAANAGGAVYNHWNGLWNMHCRTGDRSWYQAAWDHCNEQLGSTLIDPAGVGTHALLPYTLPTALDGTSNSIWNPENIIGANGSYGQMSEPFSLRALSLASAYWITGWRQHKRALARYVNETVMNLTTYAALRDKWVDAFYDIRFNFGKVGMNQLIAGYLTGCTSSFTTPGGTPGPAAFLYSTWLPWSIDALIEHQWALGDYRDGVVGMRDDALTDDGTGTGITNFQISVVAEYLMLYYDHVYPDARIPGLMQTLANYTIAQSRQSIAVDTGYPNSWTSPYKNTNPPSIPLTAQRPWWNAMQTALMAWLYAYSGNATYATWRDRFAKVENFSTADLTWQTKIWGENFGGVHQSWLHYANGGTIRGAAGVHPTVITNPPAQPDLG